MLAIKVDLEKAYDRIKWDFLHSVLEEIRLPNSWINLIMHIVLYQQIWSLMEWSSEPSSVRHEEFVKGDWNPPYLFLLCLEKLSHLINDAVSKGLWKPFAITSQGPFLSHVCFADDIVLFCEASKPQLDVMMSIINSFCESHIRAKAYSMYFTNKTNSKSWGNTGK